jgi:signal transduction histidine kinase
MHQTESDIIFLVVVACASLGVLAFFFVIVIINYYRVNARKQNEIFNAVFETQTKERKRISEDLHDELGPLLSGIKIRVGTLRDMNNLAERESMIKETEHSLDKAVQEVRVITKNLMPRHLEEHGLIAELEELKHVIEKSKTVKMNLRVTGFETRLNPLVEINMYRIINELVNNSMKHSKADTININLMRDKKGLRIFFTDNGKGFATDKSYDGIGLKNIANRINLFKGQYKMESVENSGTLFKINFRNENLV